MTIFLKYRLLLPNECRLCSIHGFFYFNFRLKNVEKNFKNRVLAEDLELATKIQVLRVEADKLDNFLRTEF